MFIEVKNLDEVFHIPEPWYIDRCVFDEKLKQLDVFVKYREGSKARCSGCGVEDQRIYDIADHNRIWRHMNFAEYPIYFHVEHPRTKCEKCNHILRLDVPWSIKPGSAFTMMYDAWIMAMAKDMPMNAVARIAGEHDTRLWRILHYYVENAIAVQDSQRSVPMKRPLNAVTIILRSLWIQKNVMSSASPKERIPQHGACVKNIWKHMEAMPIK